MNTTANTTEHGYTLASGAGSDVRHIVQVTGTYYGAYAAAAVCGTSPRERFSSTRWFTTDDTAYPTPAAALEARPVMMCKRCAAAAARMTENTTPAPAESLEENTTEDTPAAPAAAHTVPVVTVQFPALTGDVVTTAHTAICEARGHATHTVSGVDTGRCPRCGELTAPAADIHPRALELVRMSEYPDGARVDLDPATAPAAEYGTARAVVTAYFQGGPGRGECVDAVILTVTGGASHPERNFAALDALELLQARVPGNITAGQYQTLVDPDSYAGTIFIYGTWTD